MNKKRWEDQSQSYKMGWVEAEGGCRNIYGLMDGADNIEEYESGYMAYKAEQNPQKQFLSEIRLSIENT